MRKCKNCKYFCHDYSTGTSECVRYDDMTEEEYRAENNEMFQMVLQGIYHALEQFIPQVNEIFGPDGLNIIFGDELYDLSI